jgi:hypothetical protein
MNDDAQRGGTRGPAQLSQAQVEALTRSGSDGADVAHVLEAHRPSTEVEDVAGSRATVSSSKGAPVATSPEHLQEILGPASRHAETHESDDIGGVRPELPPPDA